MQLKKLQLTLISCLILFWPQAIYADKMSFVMDNDALFPGNGNDGSYTNGLRFAWLENELYSSDQNASIYGNVMEGLVDSIPFLDLDKQKYHNAGISIIQMMFTPAEIEDDEADYNDTPYAGALLASFYLFEWDEQSYHEYGIDFGVVGPASGAEEMQKFAHKVGPFNDPKGWDTQLDNQLMFGISYEYGEKSWSGHYESGLDSDWVNTLRFELGNFSTGLAATSIWRIGDNYPQGFKTYYPGSMGNAPLLTGESDHEGWSVSLGLDASAKSYYYVIDSAKEYDIDRNRFQGSVIGSASLYFYNVEASFTLRYGSSLLKQHSETKLGSIVFLWHF